MGMVSIPLIAPLTTNRLEAVTLEPTHPISRVDPDSAQSGDQAEEGYEPSQKSSSGPDPVEAEIQPSPPASDLAHQVSLFV